MSRMNYSLYRKFETGNRLTEPLHLPKEGTEYVFTWRKDDWRADGWISMETKWDAESES